MNPLELTQNTDEWRKYKCGRLGGSSIADMLTRTKSGWGAGRKNLAARLIAERLTGCPQESYKSRAMEYGNETEAEAANMYGWEKDVDPVAVGYVDHPTIAWAGCSPDRLIGTDGLIQIKCPNTAQHLESLLGGSIDGAYVKQMQWELACTGRKWNDFVTFDKRLPPEMQLHVTRVYRCDETISELEREAKVFLNEIAETVAHLKTLYALQEAA